MGEVAKKKEMEKLSFQLVLSYLPLSDPQLYVRLLLCWCSWLSPGPAWRDPCAANYLCLAASLGAIGEVVLSSSWEISPERHKPGTSAITGMAANIQEESNRCSLET